MAQNALAIEKREAGRAYLAALRALGLDPEALFWAMDARAGEDVLVLVTSLFDVAGPLGLSELLFKAHESAATPRDVNPFVLRLHSPRHTAIQDLARHLGDGARIGSVIASAPDAPSADLGEIRLAALSVGADVTAYPDAIYTFDLSGADSTPVDAPGRWRRLQEQVDKLAA